MLQYSSILVTQKFLQTLPDGAILSFYEIRDIRMQNILALRFSEGRSTFFFFLIRFNFKRLLGFQIPKCGTYLPTF